MNSQAADLLFKYNNLASDLIFERDSEDPKVFSCCLECIKGFWLIIESQGKRNQEVTQEDEEKLSAFLISNIQVLKKLRVKMVVLKEVPEIF